MYSKMHPILAPVPRRGPRHHERGNHQTRQGCKYQDCHVWPDKSFIDLLTSMICYANALEQSIMSLPWRHKPKGFLMTRSLPFYCPQRAGPRIFVVFVWQGLCWKKEEFFLFIKSLARRVQKQKTWESHLWTMPRSTVQMQSTWNWYFKPLVFCPESGQALSVWLSVILQACVSHFARVATGSRFAFRMF